MRSFLVFAKILTLCALLAAAEAGQAPIQSRSGLVWVNVTSDSGKRPLTFIVDTGAEETVLNLQTAETLGLSLGRKETVRGVGGLVQGYRSQSHGLRCAGVSLRKSFLTLDLSAASRKAGRKVDGLLGADYFHGRVVQIDYRARQLRVLSGYSPGGAAEILPIRRNYGAMCVPVEVGDASLPRMRIDTGSTGGILWSTAGARLIANSKSRTSSIGFTGKISTSGKNDVTLGSQTFSNMRTTARGGALFPGENGLLGNAVLSRFRVTIDMRRSRLILEPK
tara:strand:- start:4108 stop:4944 length:837 start_codon:yes stop_codon:yes gene_type:complete